MTTVLDSYIVGAAALLLLSVFASKFTGRFGIPSLLLFIAIGILTGSEGLGGVYYDDARTAQAMGVIALVFILFSGGLDTHLDVIRPVTRTGIALATVGVLVTCGLTGWFSTIFLGLSWLEGLLLGAIVSSTDAAAVFSVMRARSVGLQGHIKPLLEFESGSNDPMAVFLTVALISLMTAQATSAWALVPMFFQQMILGALIGYGSGKFTSYMLNRLRLPIDGLYPVASIAMVLLIFGVTQLVGGSGFLAVYLAGLVLAQANFIHKRSLSLFHDGLAWLMQIAMFLTLGILVFPSKLVPIAGAGLALSLFLIFVARPAAVFISLSRSRFDWRSKAVISWVGLRGAVPIILATYPLLEGVPKADLIFNLVFFIVLTSVLIQGTSISWVARLLRVDTQVKEQFRYPLQYVPTGQIRSDLTEVEVRPGSPVIGKTIVELEFPKDALIVLIQRRGQVVVPRGSTQLEAEDTLLVLAESEQIRKVRSLVSA